MVENRPNVLRTTIRAASFCVNPKNDPTQLAHDFLSEFVNMRTTLNRSGTSNDNIFFTGNPRTVYNEATGLPVANLGALAHDFGQ